MDYLTAPDARRIALVALESGRLGRAKDLLLQSHASVPGDDITLRILEHTAILSGDAFERRRWLDARLALNPDNPELLRAHAHLLATLGDEGAHKDIMRLEALGLDTPADRSLLSDFASAPGLALKHLKRLKVHLKKTHLDLMIGAQEEILYALDEKGKALKA